MNDQKQGVGHLLAVLQADQNAMEVPEKEIQEVIEHLSAEIKNADRKVVKSTVHSMNDEIVVVPKGKSGERVLV